MSVCGICKCVSACEMDCKGLLSNVVWGYRLINSLLADHVDMNRYPTPHHAGVEDPVIGDVRGKQNLPDDSTMTQHLGDGPC